MFIHLGGDIVVQSKDVTAIIEHNMVLSKITREFLDKKEREDQVVHIGKEETKSFVITENKVYCSPISSLTLKKRANFISSLESR